MFGAFTSNQSIVVLCKLFFNDVAETVLATACNEVVSLTRLHSGEIVYKLYAEDAEHGYVTCLAASNMFLAVGFSSGTVLVYNLGSATANPKHKGETFEIEHVFTFHNSAITTMSFADEDTQLFSGSADTHIVMYDLVASKAQYKLSGHTEAVSKL